MTAILFGQIGAGVTEGYETAAFWVSPTSRLALEGDVIREIGFRLSRSSGTGTAVAIYENTVDNPEGASRIFFEKIIYSEANGTRRDEPYTFSIPTEIALTAGKYYWVGAGGDGPHYQVKTTGLPSLLKFPSSYADASSTGTLTGGTTSAITGSVYAEVVNINQTSVITCSNPSTAVGSLWANHTSLAQSGSQIEFYTRSDLNGVVSVLDSGFFLSDREGTQRIFYRVRSSNVAAWSGWYEINVLDKTQYTGTPLPAVWA